jgi:molybdate transport system regulatory protein
MARPGKKPPLEDGTDELVVPGDDLRLMVRVAFGAHGALGPGKVRLLELIEQHGSITAAAKAMGISYRRAWLLVEGMKQAFRDPVVSTQHGGAKGGGAGLTPVGRDIVERYRAIESTARAAVGGQLRSLKRALRS